MFKSSIHTLEQFKTVLKQLTGEHFSQPCTVLFDSSIGQHTRHIIELYQCLLNGYEEGEVCYDKRERNKRIEQELDYAVEQITAIQDTLERPDKDMTLTQVFGEDQVSIKSNYYREVLYNLEHAIHHKALIKIGIKHFCCIDIPSSFGVAPSTIEHKKQCAQ